VPAGHLRVSSSWVGSVAWRCLQIQFRTSGSKNRPRLSLVGGHCRASLDFFVFVVLPFGDTMCPKYRTSFWISWDSLGFSLMGTPLNLWTTIYTFKIRLWDVRLTTVTLSGSLRRIRKGPEDGFHQVLEGWSNVTKAKGYKCDFLHRLFDKECCRLVFG
jgi:hypothetical protein